MPVKFAFKIPQLAAWMLLHQTYNSISRCEDQFFDKIDMTAQQHGVLMTIKYIGCPRTPTRIAEWVDKHLNTVSPILERMEKNGLIKKVRDTKDRRLYIIAMTEKGEKYLNDSTPKAAALVKNILECLSEEELRMLERLLEKVRLQAMKQCRKDKILKEVITSESQQAVQFFQVNPQ